jgi:hypothetical protein
MLSWIIQISIISITFIFLIHHLIGFFKTTLTVPKIKDLVNSPSQKYQYMFDTISKTDHMSELNNSNSNSNSYTAIDLLPTDHTLNLNTISIDTSNKDTSNKDVMKNELKNFLKKQMNTSNAM